MKTRSTLDVSCVMHYTNRPYITSQICDFRTIQTSKRRSGNSTNALEQQDESEGVGEFLKSK